ncbi:hypothetical protein BWGOE13_10110 [Bacillus mycoides]|uniref:Uncharacterized protein n=1 Tax=Bacillus mycoides TaxID=1405 RepID=A0A1E8BVA4_BACMY|nr:hypothetical protein IEM_04986 [Bacillus cereus BAG6O-2]OFE02290.1 hypothetical protein BWGOE11_02140 [Bacillus mycoides]OFE03293.1 hypothetical protein BWGOE13_10110 [Bacillus mycoides]
MHWIRSGDGTPQSCTSAILEIDFAIGSKNPTDVSQLAALAVGVSKNIYAVQTSPISQHIMAITLHIAETNNVNSEVNLWLLVKELND